MFVVFEGIDGSGKTTVSNLVAKALRERGIEIDHIREGGEFASPLVSRMREFGKNTQNLALRPLPEFLMYVARDAQLLAECINPTLAQGGLVFADRYLYSYEVLGHHGRGLELEQVRSIIDVVAGGVWPDLVVLMDVDPHLARARRRVSKLKEKAKGKKKSSGGGSRKGLGGVGMLHRLRDGYLQIAERDPKRWLVVDNGNSDLDVVVNRITEAIASLYEGASTAKVVASTTISQREPIALQSPTVESARDAFYEMISTRRVKEAPVAAYFLAGLVGDEAHKWRVELAKEAPQVVAYGLSGLADEGSWQLRNDLREKAPHFVAKSLSGSALDEDRAQEMRRSLFAKVPLAVLDTLGGSDSELAWQYRESLESSEPRAVVGSLRRMSCERSWEWRERYAKEAGDSPLEDILVARPLLESIRSLSDERSWEIRRACLENSPVQVLKSLHGLECKESWKLREQFADLAPKVVLRTFDGQDSDAAWAMRKRFAPKAKEAIDSMRGMDCDTAWGIRDVIADIWPSTVAKSLGDLADSERGQKIVALLLSNNPNNISLLKHATQIASALATGGAGRRRILDAT